MPNVEYLEGILTEPAEPLEGNMLKFVNSSGIIVVSIGTLVSSLPKEHLEKMREPVKELKYDVVWKWLDINYSPSFFMTK